MRERRRLRALVYFLLGAYSAFFGFVVFSVGREQPPFRQEKTEVDAWARDITCSPNWLVLGAVSRCEATVVTKSGERHPFSSFANTLTRDDVGREVPMTQIKVRKSSEVHFVPSEWQNMNWFGALVFGMGGIVFAFVGPIVVFAKTPKKESDDAPSPA